MTIAPGKRSAARGYGRKMISSFFPSGLPRMLSGQTGRKKRGCGVWAFTPGGGLGGLARGYYQAAPPGLRKGEPQHAADRSQPFRSRCTRCSAAAGSGR
jgi:hypothetical protein